MLANAQPGAINRIFSKLWRKNFEEYLDARKERLRQEHIDHIKQSVAFLDAVRLREAVNRRQKQTGPSEQTTR
jgi:hypothetical protein